MARGYWGWYWQGCRCCRSGPKGKFWCRGCDHVIKAPHDALPLCPFCREPMAAMGDHWRPGKKGKRQGLTLAERDASWARRSAGAVLLERLQR